MFLILPRSAPAAAPPNFRVSFSSLPLELRQKIYDLACTDDGKAGRTLSYLCRTIRIESKPYKFYSLIILGAKQIFGFAQTLEEMEEYEKVAIARATGAFSWHVVAPPPTVRYLLISHNPPVVISKSSRTSPFVGKCIRAVDPVTDQIPWIAEKKYQKRCKQHEESIKAIQKEQADKTRVLRDVFKILARLSPSLLDLRIDMETYKFPVPFDPPRNLPPRHDFERLTTLTIAYSAFYGLEQNGLHIDLISWLKYLHITSFESQSFTPFLGWRPNTRRGEFNVIGTKLTHLRVPLKLADHFQPREDPKYSRMIRHKREGFTKEPNLLPDNIERVYIDLGPKPSASTVRALRELSIHDPRVVILDEDDINMGIRMVTAKYT